MNKTYKIILDNGLVLVLRGEYLKDRESDNWHFYKTIKDEIFHIRKDKMVAVKEW